MYLLDTDTIIYNLKGDRNVRQALRAHIQDPMKISIVTLMELLYLPSMALDSGIQAGMAEGE